MIESKQENQVNRYLLKTNQTIEKDLIKFILANQNPPIQLEQILKYDNPKDKQLIAFIPQQMKKSFNYILKKAEEFKLTQMGTYYGAINEKIYQKSYIAFSECILMFGERLTSNFDSGFIYMKGKNCYVGEVQKGKPHGKGKVLFFEDQVTEDEQQKQMGLKLFFQGKWEKGQLESGKNIIYKKQQKTEQYKEHIEYVGKFKQFNFHGKDGERTFYGQQVIKQYGQFRNGSLIDEQNLRMSYVPPQDIVQPEN